MASKPVLIQPILMSIIFEHYKQLKEIELDMYEIKISKKSMLQLVKYYFFI